MVQTADMEGALRRLHIKYRGKRFPASVLYLCDAPGQITFNLECGKEDVHLWRFLPVDIPDGHAGEKIEKAGNGSVAGLDGVFSGGDCVSGPATVILAIAAGKVAAANIDEYLGFHTAISAGVEVPAATFRLTQACGRVEMSERESHQRKNDFELMEHGISHQEMVQECSRCLRCDHYGYAGFRGGREETW